MKLQKVSIDQLVFFLDFDGSLCPHLEVWEERSYDPLEIYELMSSLHAKAAAAYWNTGRRVESLESVHASFLEFPGYFVQGSMRWSAKDQKIELCGPMLPEALATHYSEKLSGLNEFRLEIKASSLRIAPYQNGNMESLHNYIQENSLPPAFAQDWVWHVGGRGAELLARNYDKAFALRDVLDSRESHQLIPVVVGDDLLDRPAVQEALERGGYAILVGEHCGWAADIEHKAWQVDFFNDPAEVRKFLFSLTV